MKIVLAQPRGFCAGVERAIEIVERALAKYGPPVYVRHEIVHNTHVVNSLKAQGAVFVEELDEIPEGAITVFSAHGVSEAVENHARERNLPIIDATCPLVGKVHKEGQRYADAGYEMVLIGHEGHPEVEGTMGRIHKKIHLISRPGDVAALKIGTPDRLAYVTQTTLSVDDTRDIINALTRRFPNIVGPDVKDICYATQNRQQAVRKLAQQVDVILVIGSRNSSNSNRLREIGEESAVDSYLIDDISSLDHRWIDGKQAVGVTAGASAPEELVQQLIRELCDTYGGRVEFLHGIEENVSFKLPLELQDVTTAA